MPCLTPEGGVTETARGFLRLIEAKAAGAEELSRLAEQPFYLVRSTLRQMLEAGLIREEGGGYLLTDLGKEKL